MGKRKSTGVESPERSDRSELPKRIRTYLDRTRNRSGANRHSDEINATSEKIVDEILKSPAVVSKVEISLFFKITLPFNLG